MFRIEAKGLEEAQTLLRVLNSMGNAIKGATLNAKDRQEGSGELNNEQIADWLAESGRDFFSPDDDMIAEMDKTMLAVMEQELQKEASKSGDGKKGKKKRSEKAIAQAIAAKGFMAAMEVYKKTVVARIEEQRTVDGQPPAALSEQYAIQKAKKFGFSEPIGKATGQLLDNYAPGSRNIRLKK